MSQIVFENQFIKIETEPSQIPWLKIFTQEPIKEFSQCSNELQLEILKTINIIEKEMLEYFKPDKINIASFGNYVPHVHFHIQARFKNDNYFPEPTWGEKQRDSNLQIKGFNLFLKKLLPKLQ